MQFQVLAFWLRRSVRRLRLHRPKRIWELHRRLRMNSDKELNSQFVFPMRVRQEQRAILLLPFAWLAFLMSWILCRLAISLPNPSFLSGSCIAAC